MGALESTLHRDLRAVVGLRAIRWLSRVVVASIMVLGFPMAGAAAQSPRSVLILDQSAGTACGSTPSSQPFDRP
jgi:hypothetical protein